MTVSSWGGNGRRRRSSSSTGGSRLSPPLDSTGMVDISPMCRGDEVEILQRESPDQRHVYPSVYRTCQHEHPEPDPPDSARQTSNPKVRGTSPSRRAII